MSLRRTKYLNTDSGDGGGKPDSIYVQNLIKVIECKNDVVTFLHNTKTKETAEKVLEDGFQFQSHLDYTTDVVTAKDPVTIKYFTIVRQAYGKYTLIIQISRHLIEDYSQQLQNMSHHFSEILSVKSPFLGSEDDLVYCLAPHFVKGYMYVETGEFFANPNFNASLKIPIFEENLRRILL
jgi:hypothetical protein